MKDLSEARISVIGLGYVGLPLAVEFGKKYSTLGFDINPERVRELESGVDSTLEVESDELSQAVYLSYTDDIKDTRESNIYVVTVPTPIDQHNQPETTPLERASQSIATVLKPGDLVIYESTVYPGMTEEICVPILEEGSGLIFNEDFYVGYSPERINPGDKKHRLPDIKKVTSGSTSEVGDFVDALYRSIITAGTFKTSTIKAAEASKVIENTQRDLNIALINEFALIFNKLGIDTEEVLAAASTKWNFLPFKPGLVGGHCISVDPYYLTHKAQSSGYHPEVILSGRRVNSLMGKHVASEVIKLMLHKGIQVVDSRALILGLTFKENCPDLRNTRIVDIINELQQFGINVDVHDPWVDPVEAEEEYGIKVKKELHDNSYDAIIIAVAHDEFKEMGADAMHALGKEKHVLYDVKYLLKPDEVDGRL